MKPPPEDGASAVAARLEELRGLCRLGVSLAAARGTHISLAVFRRRSLAVEGLVRGATHPHPGLDPRGLPPGVQQVCVYTSPAGARFGLGRELDLVLPQGRPEAAVAARAILVGVADESATPRDEILPGAPAICWLRFLGELPDPFRALPVLERWDARPRLWLCTEADRERLAAPEGAPEPVRRA